MKKPSTKPEDDEAKGKQDKTTDALAQAESLALAALEGNSDPAQKQPSTTTGAVPKATSKAKAKAKQVAKATPKKLPKAKAKKNAKPNAKGKAMPKATVGNKKGKQPKKKQDDKNKKGGKGQPSEEPGHVTINCPRITALGFFSALGLLAVVEAV